MLELMYGAKRKSQRGGKRTRARKGKSQLVYGVSTGVVPSATLQSKDGKYVIIGGNGDSVYSRLMAAVGRPDMSSANPLYATNTHRCQRADEIYKV
jgi:crotonobetainyl-CoA:carnitine CoA-transferase CaiB-like acyl-CoA transferase